VFDVTFVSNAQPKLAALVKELTALGYRFDKVVRAERLYKVHGTSMPLPVAEDTVVFWAIDLYCHGFEHDCILEAYRASSELEPTDLTKPAESYFNSAMAAYERGNRGLAIADFSVAIALEPANPNIWYSRGCVKDQIQMWKSARDDYDKALALAPTFVPALVNRGANKDANDEHAAAIADYDRAIAINDQAGAAFLNRGNSKLALGDKPGALADWKTALALGVESARERLAEYDTP
jgi:tetratricopeptide (TPR) repeat protein